MSYIRFENIVKNYGKNEVLKDITLDIEKGQLVTLLGPSGCGKSTLLRCLAGLEDITSGKVYLDGEDITHVSPQNRDIGMVFQQYSLFPNLTVEQNVAFGLKLKKVAKEETAKKVAKMLEVVGLSDKATQYPSQLSGGQQQRAALARALVTEPKVLLLDEPLSAIDALLRKNLQVEIRRIQKELNITAIFVTHDQDEAMVMSDVIHLLHDGQIEQSARPSTLYMNPVSRFAASFIGNYNILTGEDFAKMTGKPCESKDVAFRPEIIKINETSDEVSETYHIKGRIVGSLSHGNIMRYQVQTESHLVNADVLYINQDILHEGSECTISIAKNDCVFL